MESPDPMAEAITAKQREVWDRIYSSTERRPSPSPTVVLEKQLQAARKLQNRLREALAPFANRTAEIDQNSQPLSQIGEALVISGERVRQLEAKAYEKLKGCMADLRIYSLREIM